jgi:hypothetical protein
MSPFGGRDDPGRRAAARGRPPNPPHSKTRKKEAMKPVVRYLALAVVLAAGVFTSVALASKPPSPPGQTSNPGSPGDDCSHGNSDKPCKPDPQPGHGSECDDHGNASGNEDHCAATTTAGPFTTSTNVSSSTSTISSSTTSNITTNGGPGTTTPATPAGSTTTTISGGVAGTTTTDATTTAAVVEGASTILLPPKTQTPPRSDVQPQSAAAAERLPFTGFPVWLVALAGGLMLATGIALRRKGTP